MVKNDDFTEPARVHAGGLGGKKPLSGIQSADGWRGIQTAQGWPGIQRAGTPFRSWRVSGASRNAPPAGGLNRP